ncbi:MAG: ATP-binding protein [Chlorobaculum sp.]|nr:ATP-binding protein [Chlorobaculum sp.]
MSSLFDQVKTLDDINALIADGIRESEVLEYKTASTAFTESEKKELVKDVTGMANSLGGLIIYGVATDQKDKTLPVSIVPIESKNIETIDRVLNAQVRPELKEIKKRLIPEINPQILLIDIPESQEPPHQNLYDHKYYRRAGVECRPMEHDLVALKFGRKLSPILDLIFTPLNSIEKYHVDDSEWKYTSRARVFVSNLGRRLARDVTVLLKFPDKSFVSINTGYGSRLQNISDIQDGYGALQYNGNNNAFHPGMNTVLGDMTLVFSANAKEKLVNTPLFEWTIFADEMEAKQGFIMIDSIGWAFPDDKF